MRMTRRLAFAVAATVIASLAGQPVAEASTSDSVPRAYQHLDGAMDEWAAAPKLRLPSSYHAGYLDSWDNSVTYDDALVIIAYANRPASDPQRAASITRAKNMGDAFLQMQAKDPIGDGRLRNAYGPQSLFNSSGVPNIQTPGSALGNMAWTGLALTHLYKATSDVRYLNGAIKLGEWIINNTTDTRGSGGFTGGLNSDGTKIMWKSSEHNIDAAGFFGTLYTATNNSTWLTQANRAKTFLASMWNPTAGRFNIGTTNDGTTTNTFEYIPEDVQSWAYLLTLSATYAPALQWNIANLEVTDSSAPATPITGVRFAFQTNTANLSHNDKTVWLEGTAHMALALKCQGSTANLAKSAMYLQNLQRAQDAGPNRDGKGIQANSRVGYSGGDDKGYTSLHTGATAWYLMAVQGINPFKLGSRC